MLPKHGMGVAPTVKADAGPAVIPGLNDASGSGAEPALTSPVPRKSLF